MRHTGVVSTFIRSIFDITSDLYSLPWTYTVYLGQYAFHLGQYWSRGQTGLFCEFVAPQEEPRG